MKVLQVLSQIIRCITTRDGHEPGKLRFILIFGATQTTNLLIHCTGSFCDVCDAVEHPLCGLKTPNSQ